MNTSHAAPAGVCANEIERVLAAAFDKATIEVRDDSHLHAGHAGAREGRHFSVTIASERFTGLARVARHRLVYDCLGPLIARGIHALAIDARAPGEPRAS